MKSVARVALGMVLAGALPMTALFAEQEVKSLPTLLIKGEVVSVDANDPAAVLLKVKDRYGFETPIYLMQETKISQGETALKATDLAAGTAVEVEYNFDVNTAKRHAVSVKIAAPKAAEAAPVPAAAPTPTSAAPPMPPTPPNAAAPAPAMPSMPAMAPAAQPAPAGAPATPAMSNQQGAPATQ